MDTLIYGGFYFMKQTVTQSRPNVKGWYVVFISAFMGCTISAAFPQFSMTISNLATEMNVSEQILLASDTIKSGAIVVAMLISGFAYKKFGARITFLFALLATVIPQFIFPFTSSVTMLMLLKILQGLSSIIFPVFLLIIMDSIKKSQTGLATAIFNGIFYGGGGIGGTYAGFFIAKQGWASSFFAVGILEFIVGLIWLFTVTDPSAKATTQDQQLKKKKTEGISTKKLIAMPKVWLLIGGFFSTTFVLQGITVDMPIFSSSLGYNELETGSIMTAVTIGMIVSCLVSGKFSDMLALRMQNKAKARIYILMIGPSIIILSSLLLIIADLRTFSLFYFAVLFVSFGAAWGLGTFYSILPEMFDEETLPIITGFSGGIGDLGMPLAPMVVGVAFGFNGFWDLGWLSCAVLAVISILCCILLIKNVQTTKKLPSE